MNELDRFIKMHELNYTLALKEIRSGYKMSHWMWYIFPQIRGLGMSEDAFYYGIKGKSEAIEYLKNDYLRSHLIEISEALLNLENNDATDILGYPDDLKLKSSMTLFYIADPSIDVFKKVLDKFYDGALDEKTLEILDN